MTTHVSYCRICQASCGVLAEVEDNRIVRIIGDRDNPMSRGFACPKGLRAGDFIAGPERLTRSLERSSAGVHAPIDPIIAANRIGSRLSAIIEEHGPDAVGIYHGTQGIFATLTKPMAQAWFASVGSHKLFSTMTIDQSAKWVAAGRMGRYLGGHQNFGESDVWMLVGTNPLVSVNGGAGDGVLMQNPSVVLAEARARGLKLIVIDPRRTETAARADLHLRPRPGHEALLFAGMLNIILSEELHDHHFCNRFANGLAALATAVADVTPERVQQVADVAAADLLAAARLFARGPRGMVFTGTGVCMGPHSNLAEHLAACLNVVCGRFQREDESASGNVVLGQDIAPSAEVAPPDRTWERGYRSRLGAGLIRGELPSNMLSDEILMPGADRIRALIVSGGNPVLALPDAAKALRALSSLDMLVTIDTRMSETARIADYVIAPTMSYERADHTGNLEPYFALPYAMHADPIVDPPPGVIEDWQFFWHLAKAMGRSLSLAGQLIDMTVPPRSSDLLALLAAKGRVPLDQVAAVPHGFLALPRTTKVAPATAAARGNCLELLPDDVAAELRAALAEQDEPDDGEMRLVVRRMREVMNSLGREIERLPRQPFNPAFMHPSDLLRLGLCQDAPVTLTTTHGSVSAKVRRDDTLLPGTIAMTHCWEALASGENAADNVNKLTGNDGATQSINAMPQLSAIRVKVSAARPV